MVKWLIQVEAEENDRVSFLVRGKETFGKVSDWYEAAHRATIIADDGSTHYLMAYEFELVGLGSTEPDLASIEQRVRSTICPTYRAEPEGLVETLEGRISEADFDGLLQLLRVATTSEDTSHEVH